MDSFNPTTHSTHGQHSAASTDGPVITWAQQMRGASEHRQRAQAVEGRLSTLQNAHRLGIHVFENATDERYMFPKNFRAQLAEPYAPRAEKMQAGQTPLLHSMSLLPSTHATPMRPFLLDGKPLPLQAAYLFDLSQTGDTTQAYSQPALIPRVHEKSILSGHDNKDKNLGLNYVSEIAAVQASEAHSSEAELLQECVSPQGAEKTRARLDALGHYIDDMEPSNSTATQLWNELLVSAKPEHVQALVVSELNPHQDTPEPQRSQDYTTITRLCAALQGLQQLENGVEGMPVVIYHATGKDKGHMRYVGQSRDELRAVGLNACQQLRAPAQGIGKNLLRRFCEAVYNDDMYVQIGVENGNAHFDTLCEHTATYLGIDLCRPLAAQLSAEDKALMRAYAPHTSEERHAG